MSSFKEREKKRENKGVVASMISNNQGETLADKENEKKTIIKPKEKKETRSRRINIVVKPSTFEGLQKRCKNLNISMNECINQFLEGWIKE